MCVRRLSKGEGALNDYLARRAGEEVGAAHHVGDALIGVVHDDGQLICEQSVAPMDDEIATLRCEVNFDGTLKGILEPNCPIWDAEAERYTPFWCARAVTAPSWVEKLLGGARSTGLCRLNLAAAARAAEGEPFGLEALGGGGVGVGARALIQHWTVPLEAEAL